MIEDDESISAFDTHEAGMCQGLGACSFCEAEDIARAEKIKNATRALGVPA